MDTQRMDILYKQVQNMDSSLIDILDRYKSYSESSVPTVSVLCTENKLRQEMDMTFGSRNDIVAKVYGTYDDKIKEDEYNILLSDIVVIVTKAITILPIGLSDMVKIINKVRKPVYILLAGWEAMPKTPDMIKQRTERAKSDFISSKILGVTSVYKENADGLLSYEDAVQAICSCITEGFDKHHGQQDEEMYHYVKRHVEDYYSKAREEINNVLSELNNAEIKVMAKQNYYKTKFSFLEVRFQEIVDTIKREIDDISCGDFVDESGQYLQDIYKENGAEAKKFARKYLVEEIRRRIENLNENDNNTIFVSAESIVAECLGEMSSISEYVSKLKYISEHDASIFKDVCQNREDLAKIPDRYGDYMTKFISEVSKHIAGKVNEYYFASSNSIKIRDMGLKMKDYAEMLLLENADTDLKFDEGSATDAQYNDSDDALMLDKFMNDVDSMIQNAKIAVIAMAQDRLITIKKDIEQTCTDILKKYFECVYNTLLVISTNTEKLLLEYNME